jgi:prepilin-type N-terminal cleavage/methylation domain-containing protein
MMERRGFSLVEMVIVLVLAGLVSTAAFSMFSTQNRLNAAMTALGESQENARSAVQLAATEMRAASRGSIFTAHPQHFAFAAPAAKGVVCAVRGTSVHVFFPLNGRTVALRTDVQRKAFLEGGRWVSHVFNSADQLGGNSRIPCIEDGTGGLGTDDDYAVLGGTAPLGTPVMLVRNVAYHFEPSVVNPGSLALFTGHNGATVELASGFDETSRFEYRVAGETTWRTYVSGSATANIEVIRVVAAVDRSSRHGLEEGRASFSLVREIFVRTR